MVQIKHGIKGIAPLALGVFALYSCNDDDEATLSNNDLLIGEWKIMSVDGESYNEESDSSSYSFGFTFEADGDFGYCYQYTNNFDASENYNYCEIEGEWEWVNDEQTLLRTFAPGDEDYAYLLQIESISSDRMEGEYYEEDDPSESYSVVFEKYDFED